MSGTQVSTGPGEVANTVPIEPVAQPVAPVPSVTLDTATFMQLVKAFSNKVERDAKAATSEVKASPSKVLAGIEALPSEALGLVKKVPWADVVIGLIACTALALHFTALFAKVF